MRKTCSNRKNTQNTKHLSYAQECRQNVGIRRGKRGKWAGALWKGVEKGRGFVDWSQKCLWVVDKFC